MAEKIFDCNLRLNGPAGPRLVVGIGTPEGAVTAPEGSIYLRIDGGAGLTLYVKETGTGNTGWAPYGSIEGLLRGTVGNTAPASPALFDVWVDTN